MAKKAKPPVVKAKVVGSKHAKRMSKRHQHFDVYTLALDKEHLWVCSRPTRLEAERYVNNCMALIAPVIVHVDIPAMEY